MSSEGLQAYRRAVAEVLREAAKLGMIERIYRVGVRGARHDIATNLGSALLILDRLVASDLETRCWIAVSSLQPELGVCVQHLRFMQRVEPRIERGLALLDALESRAGRQREEWRRIESVVLAGDHLQPSTSPALLDPDQSIIKT